MHTIYVPIQVRMRATAQMRKKLQRLGRVANSMRKEDYDKIGDQVRFLIGQNFASEAYAGNPWAPLTEWTLTDREAEGFPWPQYPILSRTGRLERSWTDKNSRTHRQSIKKSAEGWMMYITSLVPYMQELALGRSFPTAMEPRPQALLQENQARHYIGTEVARQLRVTAQRIWRS